MSIASKSAQSASPSISSTEIFLSSNSASRELSVTEIFAPKLLSPSLSIFISSKFQVSSSRFFMFKCAFEIFISSIAAAGSSFKVKSFNLISASSTVAICSEFLSKTSTSRIIILLGSSEEIFNSCNSTFPTFTCVPIFFEAPSSTVGIIFCNKASCCECT